MAENEEQKLNESTLNKSNKPIQSNHPSDPAEEVNLIKAYFTGILSDIVPLNTPSLISNEKRLNDILISSISKKKPIFNQEDNSWGLADYDDDPIANKKYEIDFLKMDFIVVRGAKIDKVCVIDKEYKVTFGDALNDYEYYAVIVKAPSGSAKPKGLQWVNEKPKVEDKERVFIP